MSTTFAQLGIEFTTRTAAKAANDIDKVEKAADRAEKTTAALSGKSKRLATDMLTGANGVRRATDVLNKMHGGAKKATDGIELIIAKINKLKGVATAVVAAAGALSFLGVGAIDAGFEIERMARLSNALPSEFQRWAAGAKSVGIEQDQLADILKDVNDRIGDYIATGGGEMADFFDNIAPKVGVTAKMFRDLSGPQALQLYVDSLKKAGASQQDMTFYLEAVANDATALIPLLANGGAEMQRLGDRAAELGGILSDDAVRGLAGMKSSLTDLTTVTKGLVREFGAAMAPAVAAAADVLTALLTKGSALRLVLDGLAAIISGTATFLADLVTIVSSATSWLWDLAKAGAKAFDEFTGLSGILQTILENSPVGWIYSAVTGFADLIRATGGFGNAMSLLGDVAAGIWEGIIGSAKAIPPSLNGVWSLMKAGFFDALSQMATKFHDFFWRIGNSFQSVPALEGIGDSFMSVADAASEASGSLFNAGYAAKEAANGYFESAGGVISDSFSSARDALSKLNVTVDETSNSLGTGSSGGGLAPTASGAKKATDDLRKEVDKLNKAAAAGRTPLEKYRSELAKLEALKKLGLTDAAYSMELERINQELAQGIPIIGDVADAWGDFVASGFRDFKGFVEDVLGSFKSMLAQMIAAAARNQIIFSMGLSSTGAVASGVAGAASSGGTGGLGVIGQLAGIGGSIFSGASGLLSSLFGAGGGIGAAGTYLSSVLGTATSSIGAFGAAIGAIALPVAAVAAVFSFFSTKTKLLDSGLRITADNMDLLIQSFSTVEKSKFWGLSKKVSTSYGEVDAETAAVLGEAIGGIMTSVRDAAAVLGIGGKAFRDFAYIVEVSTKGMTDEEAQQAILDAMTDLSDAYAGMVPNIEQVAKTGEGATDTLTRLSTSLTTANDLADLLGHRLFDVSLIGADAASRLVDYFGDLDTMTGAVTTYWQTVYSESEQTETAVRRLTSTFEALGYAMPRSRAQYRALVDSIDTSTDAGMELYATMISLAGAMDAVLPTVASITAELETLNGSAQTGLEAYVTAAEAAAKANASAASDWYKASDSIRAYIDKLRGSSTALTSPMQARAYNEANYQTTLAAALAGDLTAAGNLTSVAESLRSSVNDTASTRVEAALAEARILSDLTLAAGVGDVEGARYDVISGLLQDQADLAQDMVDYIAAGNALTEDMIATLQSQLGSLDDAITAAADISYANLKKQIDLAITAVEDADIPDYLKTLLSGATDGVTSYVDFVLRSDLDADLRWLALTGASEHITTVQYLAQNKLGANLTKLAVSTVSTLQKTVNLLAGAGLDRDTMRLALAGNSELSRVVNATLAADIDKQAKRLALGNLGAYSVSVMASLSPAVSTRVRQIVFGEQGTYAAVIEAAISSDMTAAARRILLTRQGDYIANITGVLVSSMTNSVRELLLEANTAAVRSVTIRKVWADSLTRDEKSLLRDAETTAMRTIRAAVQMAGVSVDGMLFLTQISAGKTDFQKSLIGKIALGTLGADEKRLLRAADSYVTTLIKGSYDLSSIRASTRATKLLDAVDQVFGSKLVASFDLGAVSNARRQRLLDATGLSFVSKLVAGFDLAGIDSARKRALLDADDLTLTSTLTGKYDIAKLLSSDRAKVLLDANSLNFTSTLFGKSDLRAVSADALALLGAKTSSITKTLLGVDKSGGISGNGWTLLKAVTSSITKTIQGKVDLSGLTDRQKSLLDAITGATVGKVTLGGSFVFDPSTSFETLLGGSIEAPMDAARLAMGTLTGALDDLRAAIAAETARAEYESKVAALNSYVSSLATDANGNPYVDDAILTKMASITGQDISSKTTAAAARTIAGYSSTDIFEAGGYNLDASGIKRLKDARQVAIASLKEIVADIVTFDAETDGYLSRSGAMTYPLVSGGRVKWSAGLPTEVTASSPDSFAAWKANWWADGGLEDQLWAADRAVAALDKQIASFDGGGYTGAGARSGGLDGKGGFLAMLHPQERVVDEYRGQSVRAPNDDLIAEVRALREELAATKKELSAFRDQSRQLDISRNNDLRKLRTIEERREAEA